MRQGGRTVSEDRSHRATCNWNLYPDQRPDSELCNLDCLARPGEVLDAWRLVDEMPELCFVLIEDNGSFCGRPLPCAEHPIADGVL